MDQSIRTAELRWDALTTALSAEGIDWQNAGAIHLAVVNEPYLRFILQGPKTIESRFVMHRTAPYRQVSPGDIVLMKRAGQAVQAYFIAGEAMDYESTPEILGRLRETYSEAICADADFWRVRADKRYITLISIRTVGRMQTPLAVVKRDKRAWVTIPKAPEIMRSVDS